MGDATEAATRAMVAAEAMAWPVLAEVERSREALLDEWCARALAGAGVEPATIQQHWRRLQRQARGVAPLARATLPPEDLATLTILAHEPPPDLAAVIRRRLSLLLDEREEDQAEARRRRDDLRARFDLGSGEGRTAYLAALAAMEPEILDPSSLAAIGASAAAMLGVQLRNGQRLVTSMAHAIVRGPSADDR